MIYSFIHLFIYFLADDGKTCISDPGYCQNGGTCESAGGSTSCKCADGYSGISCQVFSGLNGGNGDGNDNDEDESEDDESLDTIAIILIVVAAVLLLLLIIACLVFCAMRNSPGTADKDSLDGPLTGRSASMAGSTGPGGQQSSAWYPEYRGGPSGAAGNGAP